MANNFIENFRSTQFGVQRQPWEPINSGFSAIRNPYNSTEERARNAADAVKNIGIPINDRNALIDRDVEQKESFLPIPLLNIINKFKGPSMVAAEPDTKIPSMIIWRLDGKPLDINLYLDKVNNLKSSVESANTLEDIEAAVKKGTNDWTFNNHVLGHNFARANGIPDSTVSSVLKDYLSDIQNNPYYKDQSLDEIKQNIIDGINVDFIPKVFRGGKLS